MPNDELSTRTLLAEAQAVRARLADAIEHLSLLLMRARADGAAATVPAAGPGQPQCDQ